MQKFVLAEQSTKHSTHAIAINVIAFFQAFKHKGSRKSGLRHRFLHVAYFGLGATLFIIIPSSVFYHIESGWSYLDSVYYTVISLSTIGFGDFTNSHHGYADYYGFMLNSKLGNWVWAYRAFTLVWIVFGISFFSMMHTMILKKFKKTLNVNGECTECSSKNTMKESVWNDKFDNRRRSSV